MENVLINYLRDEKKNPRGVIVAVRKDDEVNYGYSLYNPVDKWDRELGIKKAIARANAEEYNLPEVDERYEVVLDGIKRMEKRALKYFKDLDPKKVQIKVENDSIFVE